jgi:nitroimidazol reductase NimA-like FMN-containing flavoprotein (pyridoxamine 5'-phosphate oxidase superfamily)
MELTPTPRTRLRRVPKRASYDAATVGAILDEALICHLAFVHDDRPYAIPTLHARVDDVIYLHGSAASRMVRTLEAGVPACLTATLVDGLVLARSAFHHSMNYRSAVVVGEARRVIGANEQLRALEAFTEKLVPGRWDEVRVPNRKELRATHVLAMDLAEASAKIRTGPPVDDEEDYALDVWAGVIPLELTAGALVPDERNRPGTEPPDYVTEWSPSSRGSSSSATVRSTASGANGASSSDARAA